LAIDVAQRKWNDRDELNGRRLAFPMKAVRISRGDFTCSVSREVLSSHSQLIDDPSVPVDEYLVQSPVRPEILGEFMAGLEHPTEISLTGENISDLFLLSEEFGVHELTAACHRFPSSGDQDSDKQSDTILIVLESWKPNL
jgi:hypothetical protein